MSNKFDSHVAQSLFSELQDTASLFSFEVSGFREAISVASDVLHKDAVSRGVAFLHDSFVNFPETTDKLDIARRVLDVANDFDPSVPLQQRYDILSEYKGEDSFIDTHLSGINSVLVSEDAIRKNVDSAERLLSNGDEKTATLMLDVVSEQCRIYDLFSSEHDDNIFSTIVSILDDKDVVMDTEDDVFYDDDDVDDDFFIDYFGDEVSSQKRKLEKSGYEATVFNDGSGSVKDENGLVISQFDELTSEICIRRPHTTGPIYAHENYELIMYPDSFFEAIDDGLVRYNNAMGLSSGKNIEPVPVASDGSNWSRGVGGPTLGS